MFARLDDDGKVAEVFPESLEALEAKFHKGLVETFVPAPDNVRPGMYYADGKFTKAPPLSFPEVTAGQVKREAQRRIALLVGVEGDNFNAMIIKELNALMRAVELNNKIAEGGTLTAEEEAEKRALAGLSAAIKVIRAKSNEIELMDPLPSDETDDALWI